MHAAGIFALPGGSNFEKMNNFMQAFTVMKLPINEESIAPAAIQRVEDAVAGVARRVQVEDKKKWWRCENPGHSGLQRFY